MSDVISKDLKTVLTLLLLVVFFPLLIGRLAMFANVISQDHDPTPGPCFSET